jgi:hypothetical protein
MRLIFICLVFIGVQNARAQQADKNAPKPHSPKLATYLSLGLPGAGQIYNKKNWWWKVPIIYGGGAALTYSVVFYQREYAAYRDAYFFRVSTGSDTNGDPKFDRYQTPTLLGQRQAYRNARDQSIIGLVLLYTIQVVDAAVEAHFFDFNIKDDLSLNVQPYLSPVNGQTVAGIQLNFNLK